MKPLDFAFLARVYRTIGWVWLLGALFCLGFPRPLAKVIGFSIGTALSLLSLRMIEVTVRWVTVPGTSRTKRVLPIISLAKYFVIGVAFYCALASKIVSVPAMVVGLSLTWVIIVLKVLGLVIQDRLLGAKE